MPFIHDVTLRDGNHALRHQLTQDQVKRYCEKANASIAHAVEVGHGNGLGASSFLVGKSTYSDEALLSVARSALRDKKLGVHVIPGFATFKRDLEAAIALGVDTFRIAAHVTEADVCQPHIEKLASLNLEVVGVLMMSHMATIETLVSEARKLESYGASTIIYMDSAGTYFPNDVSIRTKQLKDGLSESTQIGFHAHNNLGFAVSNAVAASRAGASIIDASAAGLGAGAGNLQLELFHNWLVAEGQSDEEALEISVSLAEFVEAEFRQHLPRTSSQSLMSGRAGAFSGYSPQVKMAAEAHNISTQGIWREIGKRKLVAGQESAIWEIAQDLANL